MIANFLIMHMKKSIVLLFSLALAALFTGCASMVSNGVLVTAQRDPAFLPLRTDEICLSRQLHPSKEQIVLNFALTNELANEGFNVVTNTDADYTLACVIEDDSTDESVSRATHPYTVPSPVMTPGVPGSGEIKSFNPEEQEYPQEQENAGEPSLETTIEQVEYVHVDKGIRLYLYANPKKYSGLQIAWQGCIEAGETVSPDREPLLIRTLLGYFGQDYTGRIEPGQ